MRCLRLTGRFTHRRQTVASGQRQNLTLCGAGVADSQRRRRRARRSKTATSSRVLSALVVVVEKMQPAL